MTQPSIDSWESWLQTWRCSTPEMAAELAGRVAAVVEAAVAAEREECAQVADTALEGIRRSIGRLLPPEEATDAE